MWSSKIEVKEMQCVFPFDKNYAVIVVIKLKNLAYCVGLLF